jgi:predicted Ser/Thr protein kinase
MHEPQPIGPLTPDQFRRIREIFETALEQPTADRHAWLVARCGSDTALLQQVERMLVADDERHHLLDRSADATYGAASLACPACGAMVIASQRFCPSCGTPTGAVGPLTEGRFRAGALFAGRFRIIALQGRGGMGQVYRAQDLELGQPVALKFLTAFRSDQRARNRLRTEVRLARQISHPNVCRVYDIGEATGELYLSMEYVDGEDLAGLLKRIGRLPADKGIDIARKLCTGLAAAHARGVLHRDLKPGNIMIDSRGEVRIMDFGLAAVAEQQLDAADVRSGTPAYMAPEQLEGREATTRSDIYALGLVLYELFTGRPAFEGRDAAELLRLREAHPATTPSTLVPDLDPAVERTILRCLEPDPRMRPASALEVAALLPGGDPLAEALAAGETPSPDLVAAASPDTVVRPAVAVALVVLIGVGLAGMLLLTKQTQMVSMVPMENPPEVLASRARDIVRTLGHADPAADVAYGFRYERGHIEYLAERISSDRSRLAQWKTMLGARPAPVSFWYAQSQGPVVPLVGALFGRARPIDTFPAVRGGVSVDLDLDGRLLRFVISPTGQRARATPADVPEWSRLFTAAGLDLEHFKTTAPQLGVSTQADARAAWTGSYPESSDLPVHVEATASAGTVTSFEVVFPWTNREPPLPQPTSYANAVLVIIFSIGPILVARYNWLSGRADVRGALRIGAVAFLATLAFRLLDAHDAINAFVTRSILAFAAGQGALTGMLYVALEPWVRRWWPHAMIGWARVVAGRWRDPLVARDVLVAIATIVALGSAFGVAQLGSLLLGRRPEAIAPSLASERPGFVLANLEGSRFTAASLLHSVARGIPFAASIFFVLAMFRSLVRKPWLGTGAFVVFAWSVTLFRAWAWGGRPDWIAVAALTASVAIVTCVALRFGLLVVVVMECARRFVDHTIFTTDFAAWYGRSSLLAVLVVSVLTIWAFRVSLGGRPLLNPRAVKA